MTSSRVGGAGNTATGLSGSHGVAVSVLPGLTGDGRVMSATNVRYS